MARRPILDEINKVPKSKSPAPGPRLRPTAKAHHRRAEPSGEVKTWTVAPPSNPQVVRDRVREIAADLAEGRWCAALQRQYAIKWDVAEKTIQFYAARAAAIIRDDDTAEGLKTTRAALLGRLELIQLRSLSAKTTQPCAKCKHANEVPKPDFRAAVSAMKAAAALLGINEPAHMRITVGSGDSEAASTAFGAAVRVILNALSDEPSAREKVLKAIDGWRAEHGSVIEPPKRPADGEGEEATVQ